MYNNHLIRLNYPTGKLIGFTDEFFEYGTLWDYLPKGIYINSIYPIKGKEDEAINHLLDNIQSLRIRVLFVAPEPFVIKHLKERGYVYYTDSAGCPYWTRLSEKGIAALCGRIHITEDQLRQQSRDYVV